MSAQLQAVYIAGAGAVSACGFGWRGLGTQLATGTSALAHSAQLAQSHGAVLAGEVGAIPPDLDVDARARKLMSHPARLAAVALKLALVEAQWHANECAEAAFYLGVGASGASIDQLSVMLDASIAEHAFSLTRFGGAGLAACNPLFAFQLMNNFTLCHGAIQSDVSGPNSAFFSRGGGTVTALAEAHWQIASGLSAYALGGGADSALHPVTWSQLLRDEPEAQAMIPGEGAGLLALSSHPAGALAVLQAVQLHSAGEVRAGGQALLTGIAHSIAGVEPVILAVSDPALRERLQQVLPSGGFDVCAMLGDTLAASPALAWCAALDLVMAGAARAHVISAGLDGAIGHVTLGGPA